MHTADELTVGLDILLMPGPKPLDIARLRSCDTLVTAGGLHSDLKQQTLEVRAQL